MLEGMQWDVARRPLRVPFPQPTRCAESAPLDVVTLGSDRDPAFPSPLALSVVASAGEDAGQIGRQLALHRNAPGTVGQRLATGLTAAAEEGIGWANYRSAAQDLFASLEKDPHTPPDERDLAAVARTCLQACPDPQDGGKVAWSFLEELRSGRKDAPSQRLARVLLEAADRGLSWGNYAGTVRVGLDALESEGPERLVLEAARRAMDACSTDEYRGKMGRSAMQLLSQPLTDPPEACVGRMVLEAAEEGISWRDFAGSARAALEPLGSTPDRALFCQVAREAVLGGADPVEQARVARAFLRSLSDYTELGASLHRASRRAADENLSWDGCEAVLARACQALSSSELVAEADRAALSGPFEGTIKQRCQARVNAMKGLGELIGVRERLERLAARPTSDGLAVTSENVTVGGVRLKVRPRS